MTDTKTDQPVCAFGHGPLRRAVHMSTGLFPGFWWYCQAKPCTAADFIPYREPARYGSVSV